MTDLATPTFAWAPEEGHVQVFRVPLRLIEYCGGRGQGSLDWCVHRNPSMFVNSGIAELVRELKLLNDGGYLDEYADIGLMLRLSALAAAHMIARSLTPDGGLEWREPRITFSLVGKDRVIEQIRLPGETDPVAVYRAPSGLVLPVAGRMVTLDIEIIDTEPTTHNPITAGRELYWQAPDGPLLARL